MKNVVIPSLTFHPYLWHFERCEDSRRVHHVYGQCRAIPEVLTDFFNLSGIKLCCVFTDFHLMGSVHREHVLQFHCAAFPFFMLKKKKRLTSDRWDNNLCRAFRTLCKSWRRKKLQPLRYNSIAFLKNKNVFCVDKDLIVLLFEY